MLNNAIYDIDVSVLSDNDPNKIYFGARVLSFGKGIIYFTP